MTYAGEPTPDDAQAVFDASQDELRERLRADHAHRLGWIVFAEAHFGLLVADRLAPP